MKLPRKQAIVVREAIERWRQDGVIAEPQAALFAATIEVQYFDWRKLQSIPSGSPSSRSSPP